ncbi:MAG: F0F1 ATP synthase subunit A [Rhodothermaceae bacterium]|nr:F0F1 ATP synthase subunit A [Rhodothermaceae bacterium]
MRTLQALLLSFVALAVLAMPVLAQEAEHAGTDAEHAEEEELDALHHSADGFYLDFEPMGKVELPRIFLVRNAEGGLGLDVFGSTTGAVASGRYVLDPEGEAHGGGDHATETHVAAEEGEIEHADEEAGVVPGEEPMDAELHGPEGSAELELIEGDPLEVGIVPAAGEIVADFSFTRHTIFMLLAALLLLAIFLPIGAKYRAGVGRTSAPRGRLQNAMEAMVIYVREEIAKPTMGDKYAKYMPYLLSAFFFILFGNLLGLLPYGATMTSNIAVTAVLAGFTFVVTQFAGTKDYWGHIFNPPGVPLLVKPIMVPIEFLGIFTKPFALAIRLFANMTAGHLVILSLIGLIFAFGALFGPAVGYGTSIAAVPMTLFVYLLEILIAFIQAYVFTILSALFIGMAAAEHEHHGHEEHGDQTHHEQAVQASSPLVAGNGVYHEEEKTVGTEAAMAFSS